MDSCPYLAPLMLLLFLVTLGHGALIALLVAYSGLNSTLFHLVARPRYCAVWERRIRVKSALWYIGCVFGSGRFKKRYRKSTCLALVVWDDTLLVFLTEHTTHRLMCLPPHPPNLAHVMKKLRRQHMSRTCLRRLHASHTPTLPMFAHLLWTQLM